MKKLFVTLFAALMLVGMNLNVFAAPIEFVPSVTGQNAPKLISFTVDSDECPADIEVIPYSKRNTLDDKGKEIENVYNLLKSTKDLTTLNEDLAALAKKNKIVGTDLAISDLFDITCKDCDLALHKNQNHGYFTIKLSADTLTNFVGLLHFKGTKIELVKDATVSGNTLTLKVNDLSPFAIVVNTAATSANTGSDSPKTGDDSRVYIWAAIMGVSAITLIVCWRKFKKSSAK